MEILVCVKFFFCLMNPGAAPHFLFHSLFQSLRCLLLANIWEQLGHWSQPQIEPTGHRFGKKSLLMALPLGCTEKIQKMLIFIFPPGVLYSYRKSSRSRQRGWGRISKLSFFCLVYEKKTAACGAQEMPRKYLTELCTTTSNV